MIPRVFFRLDVAPEIGMGHLRRCSVLAAALQSRGFKGIFLVRSHSLTRDQQHLPAGVKVYGVPWESTPLEDAQRTIELCRQEQCTVGVIDHYRLEEAYQGMIRTAGIRWMQFANPLHMWPISADLVHDASPGSSPSLYLKRIRNPSSKFLCGPSYALIADAYRDVKCARDSETVLLTFGGGDDHGATLRALDLLDAAALSGTRLILANRNNPNLPGILARAARAPEGAIEVHVDNWQPASLMATCGLALCAGGTTLYELACLGIPAFIISIVRNQIASAEAWEKADLGIHLGRLEELADETVAAALRARARDLLWRKTVAATCRSEVDGFGNERVAAALVNLAKRKETKPN
jgi:UDP-2,4-diacetamido-2,4,6-trideoxy-beta-L-altropyranose hydrolase